MFRDRVRELSRVKASELRPNPRNWRKHPPAQQEALRGVLAEVGFADALLVRQCDDGALEIIDGHLRAETTPEDVVPVLVLDVNEQEAGQILATFDTLTSLAEPDLDRLAALRRQCDFREPRIAALFAAFEQVRAKQSQAKSDARAERPVEIAVCYQVVVTCEGESDQRALYERLTSDGYACRLLML